MSAAVRVIRVLLLRDVRVFLNERSRLVGALAQPLFFWILLGAGFSGSFSPPGGADGGYLRYFYPGALLMLLMFTSIGSTMSVIEDRRQGFLQGVMAAPGPRGALALGKVAGGTAVGMLHAVLFLLLLLAPATGYDVGEVNWPVAVVALLLFTLLINGMGFVLAWRLDSIAGYHVVMMLVLMPMWAISGALFPVEEGVSSPVLVWAARLDPLTYATKSLRAGLTGSGFADAAPALGILAACALLALIAATLTPRRE